MWLMVLVDFESGNVREHLKAWVFFSGAALMVVVGVVVAYCIFMDLYLNGEVYRRRVCKALRSVCRSQRCIVIEVEESPPPTPPTRKESSPWPSSRKRRPSTARRAGRRRWAAHKRPLTRRYDPPQKGDCGFAAILFAAGRTPTASAIKALRKKVAALIEQEARGDGWLAGLRVRSVIAAEHLTRKAYLQQVEESLWASPIELAAAARVEGINCQLWDGMELNPGGRRTPWQIRVMHSHYTVWRRTVAMTKKENRSQMTRGQSMPDWADAPDTVLMVGGVDAAQAVPFVTLRSPSGQAWRLPYDRSENHLQFLQRVSAVINYPTVRILTQHRNGQPWIFPMDVDETDDVGIQITRAGMQSPPTQRTVSMTQPYIEEEDEEPMQVDRSRSPETRRSSSRGPGREYDDESDPVYDTDNEKDETVFWVWKYPRDPPSGQPPMLKRYLQFGPDKLAEAWAPKDTATADVTDDTEVKIKPQESILPSPVDAWVWGDVIKLMTPDEVQVDCPRKWDLRKGLWERFQQARIIPLLHQDVIMVRFIAPRGLTPAQIQDRIANARDNNELWQLHVLGRQWVVVAMPVPHRLTMRLRDLAQYESETRQKHAGRAEASQQQAQAQPDDEKEVVRAGMRRQHGPNVQDPRGAILMWATQKAKEVIPEADVRLLTTILRSEYKTASAIMHCNSEDQVRQSIQAAYRRSGLPPPAELAVLLANQGQERQPATEVAQQNVWIAGMMATLMQQTEIMSRLHEFQAGNPSTADIQQLSNQMQELRGTQEGPIVALQQNVRQLSQRMGEWETTYLPEVLSRLPSGAPQSPVTSARSSPYRREEAGVRGERELAQPPSTQPYSQEDTQDPSVTQVQEQPTETGTDVQAEDQVTTANTDGRAQAQQQDEQRSEEASEQPRGILGVLQQRSETAARGTRGGGLMPFRSQ